MAVYVDNMRARYGRMTMCHMVADSDDELHAMAAKIKVSRRHHQSAGTYRSHYDICKSKRALAIGYGAVELTTSELGRLLIARRVAWPQYLER